MTASSFNKARVELEKQLEDINSKLTNFKSNIETELKDQIKKASKIIADLAKLMTKLNLTRFERDINYGDLKISLIIKRYTDTGNLDVELQELSNRRWINRIFVRFESVTQEALIEEFNKYTGFENINEFRVVVKSKQDLLDNLQMEYLEKLKQDLNKATDEMNELEEMYNAGK